MPSPGTWAALSSRAGPCVGAEGSGTAGVQGPRPPAGSSGRAARRGRLLLRSPPCARPGAAAVSWARAGFPLAAPWGFALAHSSLGGKFPPGERFRLLYAMWASRHASCSGSPVPALLWAGVLLLAHRRGGNAWLIWSRSSPCGELVTRSHAWSCVCGGAV